MNPLAAIFVALCAFAGMEAVAWLSHKYIMHGLLWSLHKDHHQPTGRRLQRNDSFFLIFSVPAVICFAAGYPGLTASFWAGVGISAYGLAYFFVHDVIIHQRIRLFRKTRNRYINAIRRAHRMHHRHLGPEEGECFGMLWAPLKYFRRKVE